MDVRGVEVTNQLRSAIRAKLLELGVRYDEELPDYILVMVVNKKTRQQMHEDLHLFLEASTSPFVDWLHDQVLKKLQKVTIAKKKPREFVPTVIVKQEEERKKRKITEISDLKIKDEVPTPKSLSKTTPTKPKQSEISPPREETNQNSSSPPQIVADSPGKRIAKAAETASPVKKAVEPEADSRTEKKMKGDEFEDVESSDRRLKSYINKPKITSVVSVKNRITGPSRSDSESRRTSVKRVERRLYEPVTRHFRGKEEVKSRTSVNKGESSDKLCKSRVDSTSGGIKDRLGKSKVKEVPEVKPRSIKNRLGPAKSRFFALGRLGPSKLQPPEEADVEDDGPSSPVKSHIIAVKNSPTDRRAAKEKLASSVEVDVDEDSKALASKVIVTPRPLKPLQPAQKRATQSLLLRAVAEANQSVVKQKNPEPVMVEKKTVKRLGPPSAPATGKNLAVHLNANKRMVMEKIQVELTTADATADTAPEPYIPRAVTEEQMGVVMSLFQRGNDNQKFLVTLNGYNNNGAKDKNLSDDDERLVMEVNEDDELLLTNAQTEGFVHNDSSADIEGAEEDDDIDEEVDDDEEIEAEMEDDEDGQEDESLEKGDSFENNENCCSENVEVTVEVPRKRRKLSPIIYNMSRSPSPEQSQDTLVSSIVVNKNLNASIVNDKSREKCRYWPNCSSGNKCAYLHPPVICSAFPACKFGDKCAYKHPKCKFGLSCTKLGCVFSHPSQQCKYHPFCTKPGCSYLHPAAQSLVAPEAVRAKFTWRRRD